MLEQPIDTSNTPIQKFDSDKVLAAVGVILTATIFVVGIYWVLVIPA